MLRRNVYVRRLEKQVARYKRKINLLRDQNKKLRMEQNKIKENLPLFLNDDQDQKFSSSMETMRGVKLSDDTMMKAYKLWPGCDTIVYDVIREIGQPLPTHRTLQRRIKHLKVCPGLLNEISAAKEPKVVLMFEEIVLFYLTKWL
jgi:hypothetical protein